MEPEEEKIADSSSELVKSEVKLLKYQRQEIYQFLPTNILFTKISKLSK